jgi:hypothetical protein
MMGFWRLDLAWLGVSLDYVKGIESVTRRPSDLK